MQQQTQEHQTVLSFSTAAPDAKRFGGWSGFWAQGAAIVISGFSAGELNGPSSGRYINNSYNSRAPISMPYRRW